MGLLDDFFGISAVIKLIVQALIAVTFLYYSELSFLYFPWIIAVANAFNMVDGMDGFASSQMAVICLVLGMLSPCLGVASLQYAFFVMSLAHFIFLLFNWPPHRLILGNSGSHFAGISLALLSVSLSASSQSVGKFVAFVPLAFPISDEVFVVLGRIFRGQSPLRGDKTHVQFRWQLKGLKPTTIIIRAGVISLILGLCALMICCNNKVLSTFLWP